MQTPRVRLGELLVRAGLLSDAQLEEALAEQARVGKRLGSLLVELGLVSETQVTQILSQQLSVPWVSLHHIDFSKPLLDLVPIDVVERFCLIPIYVRRVRGLGDALYVAMDDPTNGQALTEVAERSGLHVRAMIAPPSDIRAAIRTYYGIGDEPEPQPSMPARADDEEDDVKTGIHSRALLASAPAEAPRDAAPGPPAAASPGPASSPMAPAEASLPSRPAESPSRPVAEPPSRPVGPAPAPASDAGQSAAGAPRRMIALTLLDGTTIQVPAKGRVARRAERAAPFGARDEGPASVDASEEEAPSERSGDQLTARDLVAALRAQAHGADASEILGENVRWEAMFAALLSLLLKKKLITDREFVEEFKKI